MNKFYASIFAQFDTHEDAELFLVEHGIKNSIPNGGPVFSYSQTNEALNRDKCADLLEALMDMVSDHKELSEATLNFAREAIAKAKGEDNG